MKLIPQNKQMAEAIEELRSAGYLSTFIYSDDRLIDKQSSGVYTSNDFKVIDIKLFKDLDGDSDENMLALIECKDQKKGYLISKEEAHGHSEVSRFLNNSAVPRIRDNKQ